MRTKYIFLKIKCLKNETEERRKYCVVYMDASEILFFFIIKEKRLKNTHGAL